METWPTILLNFSKHTVLQILMLNKYAYRTTQMVECSAVCELPMLPVWNHTNGRVLSCV